MSVFNNKKNLPYACVVKCFLKNWGKFNWGIFFTYKSAKQIICITYKKTELKKLMLKIANFCTPLI